MTKKHIIITGGAWHHEVFGGAYKAATEFAEYLAGQGHRVYYLAWSKEEVLSNPTVHNGVEVWRYPAPKAKSPSIRNLLAHMSESRRLVAHIGASQPVEHLNGHDFLQFLGASAGLKGKGVKTSFSVHSPLVQENLAQWGLLPTSDCGAKGMQPSILKKLAMFILRKIEERTYRIADIIQTDSRFTLAEISRDYGSQVKNKGFASPLWVDAERFRFCNDKTLVRRELGGLWECRVPLFFTLRRLVPRMGLDNLIGAMSVLKQEGHDCRLIIGGTGPEKELLEHLVEDLDVRDRVFLIGRIDDDQLTPCFQAPDCFVLPTRALECFGLIILEAYACGTPVIGTPVGSIPELMGDIGQRFVTEDVTPVAIADKMRMFLAGDIPFDAANLRRYAETYSYDNEASKLCRLLMG